MRLRLGNRLRLIRLATELRLIIDLGRKFSSNSNQVIIFCYEGISFDVAALRQILHLAQGDGAGPLVFWLVGADCIVRSTAVVFHMIHQNENDWNAMEDHLQDTSDIEKGRNVITQESIAADLEDLQAEEREFEQSLQYEHDADDPLLNL